LVELRRVRPALPAEIATRLDLDVSVTM